jgi:hypothetical protein
VVGGLLGALAALVAIIDFVQPRVFSPTPPNLDVRFLLSGDSTLYYAQPRLDREVKSTGLIPLGLTVKNIGDVTAKAVVLTFIADVTMDSIVRDPQGETRNVMSDKGFNRHHIIMLGDIHPGQVRTLESAIWCSVLNIQQVRMESYQSDGTTKRFATSETEVRYELEVRLNAENSPQKVSHLHLRTSLAERYQNKGLPYFTFDFERGALTYHSLNQHR